MIRETDEYMMPDGSPRYGVRVGNGLVDTLETPAPDKDHIAPGVLADQAASYIAHQLAAAALTRFSARNNTRGEATAQELRDAHPEEYAEAKSLVTSRLGSPGRWRSAASKAGAEFVRQSEADRGLADGTLRAMFWLLALAIAPLVLLAGLSAAGISFWVGASACLLVTVALGPVKSALKQRTMGPDSTRLSLAGVTVLWNDVVDAEFISVLEAKGIPVDPLADQAVTAGWMHLVQVALTTGLLIDLVTIEV